MKYLLLSLIITVMTSHAMAEATLIQQSFKLQESMGMPYQNCSTSRPTDMLIERTKASLIQKARITCQADVEIVEDFDILRRTCGEGDRSDIARVTVAGVFKCKEIGKKVIGIGYVVYQAGTSGPSVTDSADHDAMGQCGSNIIRTSEYGIDGDKEFSRVYYKFGNVRMMTRAEYECVK